MKLSHDKITIVLEGRPIEEISTTESMLIDYIPTINLGSYVRTERGREGIIVDSIRIERSRRMTGPTQDEGLK